MKQTINLNYNDVQRILSVMEKFNVYDKSVRLVHDSCAVGYTIDLQFEYLLCGELVTVTVPVATSEHW
jgi:hypothetical protein